jgi:hypothetical protein
MYANNNRWLLAAGFLALGMSLACGETPESGDSPSVETRSDDLVAFDGQEFKYLSPIQSLSSGTGDASFCTLENAAHSKIYFTRDTSGFIQGLSDIIGIHGSWGKYGGTTSNRKFATHAACAFLGTQTSSSADFIVFARGSTSPTGASDKHLFWSRGTWTTNSQNAPPPAAQTQWAQLDNTTYNSNGMPAAAAHDGSLIVIYLNDSGAIRANYWTGSGFSTTVNGPAMPSGWTATGTPTIVFVGGWAQKFLIFVRATNSVGSVRVYQTFFQDTAFVGAPGGPPSFTQVTLPAGAPQMQSDPALEFDSNMSWTTLYYRNGTKLYQTSTDNVNDFAGSTIKQITFGGTTPSILNTANPVAIGGVPYEAGRHWVLVRGTASNAILFGESFNDENLSAN